MNNKLVSVITPVYNHENFVGETIQSVLDQTYQNWEMLVVDDCSTDGSWEVMQKMAKKDSRIKIFKNEINRGLIWNWEFLIEKSQGEFIAFLEGDDVFYSENLAKKMNIFEKYSEVKMVYCELDMTSEKGEVTLKNYYQKNKIKIYQNQKIKTVEYLLSKIAPFSTYSQIMIKRDIVKSGLMPRSLESKAKVFLPSDWDYNFRISTKNKVFFIEDALIGHRKHSLNNSADMLKASMHYDFLFLDYENKFKEDKEVLKAIDYQRGKIKYLIILYYLENGNKHLAWKEFVVYVRKHPFNLHRDFFLNFKLFFRLLLPQKINTLIVNKYYGK